MYIKFGISNGQLITASTRIKFKVLSALDITNGGMLLKLCKNISKFTSLVCYIYRNFQKLLYGNKKDNQDFFLFIKPQFLNVPKHQNTEKFI